ncbi:MAG: hypothetical protein WBM02_11935 [bacterium]
MTHKRYLIAALISVIILIRDYLTDPITDPVGPGSGSQRVTRGGG